MQILSWYIVAARFAGGSVEDAQFVEALQRVAQDGQGARIRGEHQLHLALGKAAITERFHAEVMRVLLAHGDHGQEGVGGVEAIQLAGANLPLYILPAGHMRRMHPLQTRTQCIVVAADEKLAPMPQNVQLHTAVEEEVDVAAGTAKETVLEVNLPKRERDKDSL